MRDAALASAGPRGAPSSQSVLQAGGGAGGDHRWTSHILEIRWPYLTRPAELEGTVGATGGTDGGSGDGPATDAPNDSTSFFG